LPPHWVKPAAHVLLQEPREQTWPCPQATPQEPQFNASDCVSTQLPAQSSSPRAHPGVPWGGVSSPEVHADPSADVTPINAGIAHKRALRCVFRRAARLAETCMGMPFLSLKGSSTTQISFRAAIFELITPY
jgi:hypothetical protein